MAFLRSKPCEFTSPTTTVGVGRVYASAALYPGVFVNSASLEVGSDDMDGDSKLSFRVDGDTDAIDGGVDSSPTCPCGSSEFLDVFDDGEDGDGEGNGISSTEKIDRSSPFH